MLEPLDLVARLVALIPPPRFHMLRCHGVLAARRQPTMRNHESHAHRGCPSSVELPPPLRAGGSSSSSSAAALRALGDRWAYRIVIVSDACPSSSCTSTGFAPRIIRCDAYVCRLCRARHKRHTYASHLMMRGAKPVEVQELLGHASLTMTMRYAHLSPSARRAAAELLDAAPPRHHSGTAEPLNV